MKIEFKQSGGFTGLTRSIKIDLDKITFQEAESLKSLVNQSRFFNLPEPDHNAIPDEEQIFISVKMTERSRTIYMGKSKLPDDLKPLVKYLSRRAKYDKSEK